MPFFIVLFLHFHLKFHLISALIDPNLVSSFIKYKNLKYNFILTCNSSTQDQIILLKELNSSSEIMTNLKNMNNINILNEMVINYKKVGIIMDGDCEKARSFLQRCGKYKIFDTKHFWLILSRSKSYEELFFNVNLNVDCDVKFAKFIRRGKFIIFDVYNPAFGKGGTLKSKKIGYFNARDNNYSINEKENKYYVRRNLSGIKFNSALVLSEPFEGTVEKYLMSDENKVADTLNRFHARLMHYCQKYYNFSVDIKVTNSWGFLKPDGTMDGVVGELERKSADFGSTPLICKKERTQFISYGRNAWPLRMAFILRNPNSKRAYEIFTKPFSFEIWICVIISIFLITFAQKLRFSLDHRDNKNLDNSWSLSSLYTLGVYCQQGLIVVPYSLSGKCIAIVALFLSVLIYQFYSANLISFLLNVPVTVISTVQEILSNQYQVGFENVLYATSLLRAAPDNDTKEILRRVSLNNDSGFLTRDEGMENVRNIGHYAFHVELVTAYPFIEKYFQESEICELKTIPLFPPMYMYANYQKWSPFKDIMDVCLQKLGENGVIARELIFWHPRRPECVRSSLTITINTSLDEFYPALVILFCGIILSLFILIIEILWRNLLLLEKKSNHVLFQFTN